MLIKWINLFDFLNRYCIVLLIAAAFQMKYVAGVASFPPKSVLKFNHRVLESRRIALETYLRVRNYKLLVQLSVLF